MKHAIGAFKCPYVRIEYFRDALQVNVYQLYNEDSINVFEELLKKRKFFVNNDITIAYLTNTKELFAYSKEGKVIKLDNITDPGKDHYGDYLNRVYLMFESGCGERVL